jgi:phosphotransferase system HPr (HPr) family protein
MDQPKSTRTVTVANRSGLHARAALMIFNVAKPFAAQVEIVMAGQRANAAEVLSMMCLRAECGQELVLEATGSQASEAVEALAELFAAGFHEDDIEPNRRT